MKASHAEYNYFKEILNIAILKRLKQLITILKFNLNWLLLLIWESICTE